MAIDWRSEKGDQLARQMWRCFGRVGVAINLRSERVDQLACFVWRSNGVPKVCRSLGLSEMAMDWPGECDNQLACQKWRSNGVPKVAFNWRVRSGDQSGSQVWRSLSSLSGDQLAESCGDLLT